MGYFTAGTSSPGHAWVWMDVNSVTRAVMAPVLALVLSGCGIAADGPPPSGWQLEGLNFAAFEHPDVDQGVWTTIELVRPGVNPVKQVVSADPVEVRLHGVSATDANGSELVIEEFCLDDGLKAMSLFGVPGELPSDIRAGRNCSRALPLTVESESTWVIITLDLVPSASAEAFTLQDATVQFSIADGPVETAKKRIGAEFTTNWRPPGRGVETETQ